MIVSARNYLGDEDYNIMCEVSIILVIIIHLSPIFLTKHTSCPALCAPCWKFGTAIIIALDHKCSLQCLAGHYNLSYNVCQKNGMAIIMA